jgi:long-chain fatty acid transport protein
MAYSLNLRPLPPRPSCFHLLFLWLGLVVGNWPCLVLGVGSRIPNQDAEAIGRGNAFAATADNPSALYYNPAGITQLQGNNVQLGALAYLGIYVDYESPSGERFENKRKLLPVPSLDYVFTPEDQPFSFGSFSFGFGVYAPFGLGMEWPDDVPFRTAGLKAALTFITINPVVAWKPHRTLSIAAGPTFNYSEAELIQGVGVSPMQFRFKGHDWAFGFNAGILWQPLEKWSFGAKYFSATTLDYAGAASFNSPSLPPDSGTKAHLDMPQIVAGGISFRPTTNWNVEFDVDWTDWDRTKSVDIDGFGSLPLNWHSSFMYEVGATRQICGGYYASLGYFFCQKSTSDRDYTPLVPDGDLHVGSLGVGYKGKHWRWAFAGQLIGGAFHNVNDASNPSVNGRYRLITPTISASLGYHF